MNAGIRTRDEVERGFRTCQLLEGGFKNFLDGYTVFLPLEPAVRRSFIGKSDPDISHDEPPLFISFFAREKLRRRRFRLWMISFSDRGREPKNQ